MKLLLARFLSYFPTPLPVGVTEFNVWADSIIALSGQFASQDSMRFALASMVIHSDSKRSAVPKHTFVKLLRKSAANQVASQIFQDIKTKQAVEVTAAPLEAASGQTAN